MQFCVPPCRCAVWGPPGPHKTVTEHQFSSDCNVRMIWFCVSFRRTLSECVACTTGRIKARWTNDVPDTLTVEEWRAFKRDARHVDDVVRELSK
jgi:hypothetical protein